MDTRINKVGLAVVRNSKLLLVRNKGTNLFLMPGGKVEVFDCSDAEALERKIMEELQCSLDLKTVRYLGSFSDVAANNPGKIVEIKLYAGDLLNSPICSSEIAEFSWHELESSDRSRLSPIVANKIVPYLLSNIAKATGP